MDPQFVGRPGCQTVFDREGTVARFPANQPGGSYVLALEPGENRLKLPQLTRTGTGTEAVYRNAIQSHPNDGPGNRIAAVLGASLLRSSLMNDSRFPVPQADRGLYYRNDPVFLHAKAIHEHAIARHAFCFGYDEVELDAGNGERGPRPSMLDGLHDTWAQLAVAPYVEPISAAMRS
ncbi:hypothetical protein JRI60_07840 [Archangium violaceum]|uniref:beta-1,3-glucanase family protein n=1 Tax=Archangium violaceum TaxID=83451 RepID=UPI00194F4BA2|nr:beta-1,3-glucanase family protein [Archangium violaceum]QRN98932.1 hypothetical protein JRI60_07840 [Archangium violaceum]